MSASSERIDLNSDVVLTDPENEAAVAEKKAAMAGSLVEEEEEEEEAEKNKVRVIEGETKEEGLESEVSERVVNGGKLEDISLNVVESEECKEKDETLIVNEAPLGGLEADLESWKGGEDLVGNEKKEGVSFELEKEKASGEKEKVKSLESDKGACSAVNLSSNSGDSSCSRSIEGIEPETTRSAESVRELKDDSPAVEVEEKVDLGEALVRGDTIVSTECGTVPSDGLQKGVLDTRLEAETKETRIPESSGIAVNSRSNLGDSSHSQNLEAVEAKTMGSVESLTELKEECPAMEVEEKVDSDESLARGEDKVSTECRSTPADGENGVLEVHLEADTQETSNESNSFNIVIDLNPKSSASKPKLGVGDLVWGKVRSHPWWPGLVCDPNAASQKAKKYFKRDAYLIAYFGDNTFAWNESSMVKPFLENFCQMEKNSNTEDFHHAIVCALDEVSRRVEFGLSCSCLSEEVCAKVKTQIIVNAGIREELSRRDGGDSSLTGASFEPNKLVGYIKELAQVPYDVAHDRLELALARSQLLAFYRFKGYSQLPEFNILGGILDNDAEISLSTEKKHRDEASGAVDPEHKDDGGSVPEKGKSKSQNSSSLKRKLNSKDSTFPSKKEKSLSDLMAEKRMKTPTCENVSEGKDTSKKRKAGDATSEGPLVKETKSMAIGSDKKPVQKHTFRVGDSIKRVASQLNGLSPILKNGDGMPQTKSKEKTISEESKAEELVEREHSPYKMLSQLCLAAKDPMRVNNSSVVTFFSEFRDTVSLDLPGSEENESLEDLFGSGKTGKEPTKNGRKSNMSGMNELPHRLGLTNESYWSERIGRSIPEDQNEMGYKKKSSTALEVDSEQKTSGSQVEKEKSQTALELDSEQKTAGENLETELEKPVVDDQTDSSKEDLSPTALILNFTDLDSVPSKGNLNKIFSSYESLSESETEVFKKSSRAKVVFKRRSDAETAFSSAGKYSTFGPSLVSYRLKYSSSMLSKASPNSKKRSKTDKASAEDNAK